MADDNARVPHRAAFGTPLASAVNHVAGGSAPATTRSASAGPGKPAAPETKDSLREIVETVVFVVVLVLLLKSFVAEAFVIPTGSMAETLWGYQKVVDCPKCRYKFPVNCSSEVDPQPPADRSRVVAATCPNCRQYIEFVRDGINPSWNTGDRVLVSKFLYDSGLKKPQRHDVVVFKYPEKPQKDHVPMNYIKRLIGLPGETIAIYGGNIYYLESLQYDDSHIKKEHRWQREYTHMDDPRAIQLFKEEKFRIVRKAPDKILALSRIVYDNEFQDKTQPPRWVPGPGEGSWQPLNPSEPKVFKHAARPGDTAWLRYQHLLRDAAKPRLITDFMGYNTWVSERPGHTTPPQNWVGDLILEFEVQVEQAQGTLTLELNKGMDRFQARLDLGSGMCTLVRRPEGGRWEELDSRSTSVKKSGTYRLRFANVDDRLTLWVDGGLPFGDGVAYEPSLHSGPHPNDLEPASIGVQGAALQVSKLKLSRDTYYTAHVGGFAPEADARLQSESDWGEPNQWEPLRQLPVRTFYVQPDHYLCMGDNSPESSDGRTWGLVPQRLLLGRALFVYYPFWPLSEMNRAGPIK
jgi:signal peptidase I